MAPVVLLTARPLQGLSVGGEYGVSAAYLAEMATRQPARLLLQLPVPDPDWGAIAGAERRAAAGLGLALVARYLHQNLTETPAFEARRHLPEEQRGSLQVLRRYPRAGLTVAGLTAGGTLAFYTFTTYMLKLLVNTAHMAKATAANISFGSLLVFAAIQPLFRALPGRIGRRPLLIFFGVGGLRRPLAAAFSNDGRNQDYLAPQRRRGLALSQRTY